MYNQVTIRDPVRSNITKKILVLCAKNSLAPIMKDIKRHVFEDVQKALDLVTKLYGELSEKAETNDDAQLKFCMRALISSQSQLLKAFECFNPENRVPLETGETWHHYRAKNQLVNELSPTQVIPQFDGFGGYRPDALVNINGRYAIVEAETKPSECLRKIRKLEAMLATLTNVDLRWLEVNQPLLSIRKDLEEGKPLRAIFGVTTKPQQKTLENLRKEQHGLISAEIKYVKTKPPFEPSIDLLKPV
jgi:hypothetical protein